MKFKIERLCRMCPNTFMCRENTRKYTCSSRCSREYRKSDIYNIKYQSPESKTRMKAQRKEYRDRPENKARVKAYQRTPERKAKQKEYTNKPEYKARMAARYKARVKDNIDGNI